MFPERGCIPIYLSALTQLKARCPPGISRRQHLNSSLDPYQRLLSDALGLASPPAILGGGDFKFFLTNHLRINLLARIWRHFQSTLMYVGCSEWSVWNEQPGIERYEGYLPLWCCLLLFSSVTELDCCISPAHGYPRPVHRLLCHLKKLEFHSTVPDQENQVYSGVGRVSGLGQRLS